MHFILGAALIVAAFVLLHGGKLALDRAAALSAKRAALIGDVIAIGFTALTAAGFLTLLRELLAGPDATRLILVAVSLATVVVASKIIAAAFRRVAAKDLTGAIPH